MTEHPRRPATGRLPQFLRYGAASAVSTTTSLVTLGLLVGVAGLPAVLANVVATAVGTVPSFELNRRWVWRRRGPVSAHRQVVPFCALSFAGLLVSSLTVDVAGRLTAGSGTVLHTAAVELANVAAYGSLWILQFVLLDRVLFRPDPVPEPFAPSDTVPDDHAGRPPEGRPAELALAGAVAAGTGPPPLPPRRSVAVPSSFSAERQWGARPGADHRSWAHGPAVTTTEVLR